MGQDLTSITPGIQKLLTHHAEHILGASKAMGVPATALAAAVAEEMTHVYSQGDGKKNLFDTVLDSRFAAITNFTPEEIAEYWKEEEAAVRTDTLRYKGAQGWLKQTLQKYILNPVQKYSDPLAADLGPWNFNLGTAIALIHDYNAEYMARGTDPLELGQYAGYDYHQLAEDLADSRSPTGIKLAAYLLRRGVAFYGEAYGSLWQASNEQAQAAALTVFYKYGETHLRSIDNGATVRWSTIPRLAGSRFSLDPTNWQKIKDAIAPGDNSMPSAPDEPSLAPAPPKGGPVEGTRSFSVPTLPQQRSRPFSQTPTNPFSLLKQMREDGHRLQEQMRQRQEDLRRNDQMRHRQEELRRNEQQQLQRMKAAALGTRGGQVGMFANYFMQRQGQRYTLGPSIQGQCNT